MIRIHVFLYNLSKLSERNLYLCTACVYVMYLTQQIKCLRRVRIDVENSHITILLMKGKERFSKQNISSEGEESGGN